MKTFSQHNEVNQMFDLGFKNTLAFQDMCKTDELSGFYTGILNKEQQRLKISDIMGNYSDFEYTKELADVRNIFTPGMSVDNHQDMFYDMVIEEILSKGNNAVIINSLHLDCLRSSFNKDKFKFMNDYFSSMKGDSLFIGLLAGKIAIHFDSSINSTAYPVMCSFNYNGKESINLNILKNMECVSNPYSFFAGPPLA